MTDKYKGKIVIVMEVVDHKTDSTNFKTLLGLSEFFLSLQPPQIREAIHCVQASLSIASLSTEDKARCRLNLAKLLLSHTRNVGHARGHLEQAHQLLSFNSSDDCDKLYFESTSLLAKVCNEQGQAALSKKILRKALERSVQSKYLQWHYVLIFQLSECHCHDKEYDVAIELLTALGEATAAKYQHDYIRLLCIMSKCLLYLALKDFEKFEQCLLEADNAIKLFAEQTKSRFRYEIVKTFFGFLKVYYFVCSGKPKSAKEDLRELQKTVQDLAKLPEEAVNENDPQAFHWMSREQLCVLAYLVTVMHSMHAGTMEKALRHVDKAFALIEKIKVGDDSQLLKFFILALLEHAVMCKIVQGQGSMAIQDVGKMCALCGNDPNLMSQFKPAVHTILGLYAMSMNLMVDAETHFKKALATSNNKCDVFAVAALNLGIIYIREGANGEHKFQLLVDSLKSETITRSKNLRASYFYMMGLKRFFDSNFDDARKFLKETLRMGHAEDLSRMTTCSLILLGHIAFASKSQDTAMLLTGLDLAKKIPDVYLQMWASSLLKDMYYLLGNVNESQESAHFHNMYTTQLLQDHFQAGQKPEHALLKDFI